MHLKSNPQNENIKMRQYMFGLILIFLCFSVFGNDRERERIINESELAFLRQQVYKIVDIQKTRTLGDLYKDKISTIYITVYDCDFTLIKSSISHKSILIKQFNDKDQQLDPMSRLLVDPETKKNAIAIGIIRSSLNGNTVILECFHYGGSGLLKIKEYHLQKMNGEWKIIRESLLGLALLSDTKKEA